VWSLLCILEKVKKNVSILDYDWLKVNETIESKTVDKKGLLYINYLEFFVGHHAGYVYILNFFFLCGAGDW
jgi:hypothetical protein